MWVGAIKNSVHVDFEIAHAIAANPLAIEESPS